MPIDLKADLTENTHCAPIKYNRVNHITVLQPDSYENLPDKPSINGVVLTEDRTAGELNLLPSRAEDYKYETSLGDKNEGENLIVVRGSEPPAIMPIKQILQRGVGFFTRNDLDKELVIGSYQFVEKKEG